MFNSLLMLLCLKHIYFLKEGAFIIGMHMLQQGTEVILEQNGSF